MVLDRMIGRGNLTEGGKAAVIAALDPFHDLQIQGLNGWPDLETGPSVVRCVKQSVQLSGNNGGSYVIQSFPLLNQVLTSVAARNGNVINSITSSVNTDQYLSALEIRRYTAGASFHNTGFDFQLSIPVPDQYLRGKCRLIGMGFEIHDVTPELYKQGTLTAYQISQTNTDPNVFQFKDSIDGVNTTFATAVNAIELVKWPASISEAMLLPGSRQWEAKEGVYTVIPFTGKDNYASAPTYTQPYMYATTAGYEEGGSSNATALQVSYPNIVADDYLTFPAHRYAPVHSKGVIISGLAPESRYTVNVNYYIETFPDLSDQGLLTLASPSSSFDPVALEIISQATKSLPVAVPVSENGFGDWFASIIAEVAPFAAAIATGLGHPELGALAMAAGQAAKTYSKRKEDKKNTPIKTAAARAPNSWGANRPAPTPPARKSSKANLKKRLVKEGVR